MAERAAAEEVAAADAGHDGSRTRAARHAAIVAAAVAVTVVLIGGYAGHWAWTGFDANGQLWDWMNLLLLPVAFGTLPLWLRFADRMAPLHRRALAGSVLAFVLFALAGYLAPLVWTGFRGQTLWDWLTLVVLPVTLTTVRAWPATAREVGPIHLTAVTSLAIGWLVTLVGGYAYGWTWTGYAGNTLWDWLQLLLAPIAINIFVVPELIRLESGNVEERAERERERLARERALRAARERMP